jgi:acetyltransferase-like isoleucine patch superfamily enzyme
MMISHSRLRAWKCSLLIKYYRLKHVHPTAYMAYGSYISRDLVAGEFSYVGLGSMLGPGVSIGAYSMLGPRVMCLGDDHRFDVPGTAIIFSGRPPLRATVIGKDVWIGAQSVILAGVEIGDGAIVAAGSIVSKSIPPFEIHGGTPNHKIRDRFPEQLDRERHLDYLRKPPVRGAFPERRV